MSAQSETEAIKRGSRPGQNGRYCCCGWCGLLFVIIAVVIAKLEAMYGTDVPGYITLMEVRPWDNVRILYKDEPGYTGLFVERRIWISARNYELLPFEFNVYRGDCEGLNDNIKVITINNRTEGICEKRCTVDKYLYFVTHKGSWVTIHVNYYFEFSWIDDRPVPSAGVSDVVLRFVLFDDYLDFSSFINGSNDTIPLQQFDIDEDDQNVTFNFSEMKKPASYYFFGIEIIGTDEFIFMDINASISQVVYYVSNLMKENFASSVLITGVRDKQRLFNKQCFIVQAVPRVVALDTYNPPPEILTVTVQVFDADKSAVHVLIVFSSIFIVLFIGCILRCMYGLIGGILTNQWRNVPTSTSNRQPSRTAPSDENNHSSNEFSDEDNDLSNPVVPSTPPITYQNEMREHESIVQTAATSSNLNLESYHSSEINQLSWYDHLVDFLKSKSAIDCLKLGRHLGIPREKLSEIEREFCKDKAIYINQVMCEWQSICPESTERQESVQAIADALKASGYYILSAIVINQFGGDTSQAITNGEDDKLLDQLFSQNIDVFNQEPSMDDLCRLVMTDEILAKWELFGTLLGIPKHAIDVIKRKNLTDFTNCFLDLIHKWEQTQSKPYTWSTVITVLHSQCFNEHLLDEKVYKFCSLS